MQAAEWIDRLKKAKGWDSDYRVSKELGITRGAMSEIRNGRTHTLGEDTSIKVAEVLGEQPEIVLLDQLMERSKSTQARSALQRVLQGLGGVAASLLVACGLIGSPAPSHASTASISSPLYIMSNRWRYIFRSFSVRFNVG